MMYSSVEDIHKLLEASSRVVAGNVLPPGQRPKPVCRRPRAKTAPSRPLNNIPDPAKFLKKNQRVRNIPVIDRDEYKCTLPKRPPVPKPAKQEKEIVSKNFVKDNVDNADKMVVKYPIPRIVVSCKGSRENLDLILEGKRLVESEKYGHVPKYIIARKKLSQLQEKRFLEQNQPAVSKTRYAQVTDEQRNELLKGLKERWTELYREFLILPMQIDTISQIRNKLRLEKELTALEKDISLIENNPFIYLDLLSNGNNANHN